MKNLLKFQVSFKNSSAVSLLLITCCENGIGWGLLSWCIEKECWGKRHVVANVKC